MKRDSPRFAHYSVTIETGDKRYTVEESIDGVLCKRYYQLQRWPGRKEFLFVLRQGLSAAEIEKVRTEDAAWVLEGWSHLFSRRGWVTHPTGSDVVHAIDVGYPVDESLIDLELEWMIDLAATDEIDAVLAQELSQRSWLSYQDVVGKQGELVCSSGALVGAKSSEVGRHLQCKFG